MQFQHFRQNNDLFNLEGTLAVNTLTKQDLHLLFNSHANQMLMNLGLTIKSDKDQFNKKIGREQSLKRTQQYVTNFLNIEQKETTHIYEFHVEMNHNKNEYDVYFKLTTVDESDRVYLIDAFIVTRGVYGR